LRGRRSSWRDRALRGRRLKIWGLLRLRDRRTGRSRRLLRRWRLRMGLLLPRAGRNSRWMLCRRGLNLRLRLLRGGRRR
jgi:hypothetical protein